jgi:hypothetical protein
MLAGVALAVRGQMVGPLKWQGTALLAGCILSALAQSNVLAEESFDDLFHDIALQCPDADGGTLELTRGNKRGQRDRITIVYDGDVAVRVDVAAAERGGAFETYFTSDSPETEADPDQKEFADTILAKYGMLRRGVCLAPENERDRYFQMLERQRRLVPL